MHRAGELCAAGSSVELNAADIVALIERGATEEAVYPDCCALIFSGRAASPSELHILADASWVWRELEGHQLVLVVTRKAMARLGGEMLLESAGAFHLPTTLRGLVMTTLEPQVPLQARVAYRFAKSIEIVCETLKLYRDGDLLPLASDGVLSAADTRRILAAQRLIEERCNEKLTLDAIARSCGLNRSKLTRGFRDLFKRSVAEALSERRLELASSMLLTTDLPIASVGYEAGYENKASFARAFGRRYGRTPSDYRTNAMAA